MQVDSMSKLASLSPVLLGAALFTAIFPARWFLLLAGTYTITPTTFVVFLAHIWLFAAGVYLFTVQSAYMNFPNLRKRYFWPDIAMRYVNQLREKYRDKLPAALQPKPNATASVPAALVGAVQNRSDIRDPALAATTTTAAAPDGKTHAAFTEATHAADLKHMSEGDTLRALAADISSGPATGSLVASSPLTSAAGQVRFSCLTVACMLWLCCRCAVVCSCAAWCVNFCVCLHLTDALY